MANKTVDLTSEQNRAIDELFALLAPIEDKKVKAEQTERLRAIIQQDIIRLNPGWKVHRLYIGPNEGVPRAFLTRPDADIIAGANIFFDKLQERLLREED